MSLEVQQMALSSVVDIACAIFVHPMKYRRNTFLFVLKIRH